MRIFSYILRHDGDNAPNPFHGACALACCKPKIRSSARLGDLILGLTGKGMSFADYWHKYPAKRPDMTAPDRFQRSGDNYEPTQDDGYRQIPCQHSDTESQRHDLGADNSNPVLVGGRFCYFSLSPIDPSDTDGII